jgi:hypothetical protein
MSLNDKITDAKDTIRDDGVFSSDQIKALENMIDCLHDGIEGFAHRPNGDLSPNSASEKNDG